MAETKPLWKGNIPEIAWLASMTLIGVVKIIVGCLYANGGCLGFAFFPYFLVLGGVISMVPACIALVTSVAKKSQSRDNLDMWGFVAKLFFIFVAVLVFGTIYVLVSVTRVVHLNRLCTDVWVPAFGLCLVAADWIAFGIFLRLFCVNSIPQQSKPWSQDDDLYEESPFYTWKHRRVRR